MNPNAIIVMWTLSTLMAAAIALGAALPIYIIGGLVVAYLPFGLGVFG